jgi:Flp pilus assembly pilin Flp
MDAGLQRLGIATAACVAGCAVWWWWLVRPRKESVMPKPRYTVELYRDANREYRWRIVHRNGHLIACCGEGYRTKLGRNTSLRHLLTGVRRDEYVVEELAAPAAPSPRGQALVEYALLLALISVVCLGVLRGIGQQTQRTFTQINDALVTTP